MTLENEELRTAEEVANFLKLTKNTVLIMAKKGQIPHYKLGPKVVRFRMSEVENALKAGETK